MGTKLSTKLWTRPIVALALLAPAAVSAQGLVQGQVIDRAGKPVPGVRARVSPLPNDGTAVSVREFVTTDADGRFEIPSPGSRGEYLYIGFGKQGYEVMSGVLDPSRGLDVGRVGLTELSPIDNTAWKWTLPYSHEPSQGGHGGHGGGDEAEVACSDCHGEQVNAWKDSLMANSASPDNSWVMSLYGAPGTADQGPAYRRDNPDKAGPCANCHAPAAAVNAPNQTVLHEVQGVEQHGVFCAVCHQVRAIDRVDRPGVDGSLVLHRPSAWQTLFAFGPYDDAGSMPMTTAYSDLLKTARFCSGCHEWTNDAGVPVLSTYSEWSEMSGADADALQCQDCHMKKRFGPGYTGEPEPVRKYILDNEAEAQHHAFPRWSDTMHGHEFHGGKEYAAEAALLEIDAVQQGNTLVVTATVSNVNAGHALPTGMPFRHAILVVEAVVGGQPMTLTSGSVVPDYGGAGGTPQDFAGLPGKGYAKVLGDGSGARNVLFWKATEVIEDTRIRAGESEALTFRFGVPAGGGPAAVRGKLIYRRAFIELARAKNWTLEDIEMDTTDVALDLTPAAPDAPAELPMADVPKDDCKCNSARTKQSFGGIWLTLLLFVPFLRRRSRS